MLNGIRQKTVVQSGGMIQLRSAELPEGANVEVIVLLEPSLKPSTEPQRLLTSFIGAAKGSFATLQPKYTDCLFGRRYRRDVQAEA